MVATSIDFSSQNRDSEKNKSYLENIYMIFSAKFVSYYKNNAGAQPLKKKILIGWFLVCGLGVEG